MCVFRFLTFVFFVALASCGGGGSPEGVGTSSQNNSNPASGISGVVMDGYLSNATVFLDLNDNGVFDVGEPTTVTDASGAYVLNATTDQLANHSIVVNVEAGTAIDQDNASVSVSDSYHLTAPKGMTTITPLTTHIKSKISAGSTQTAAIQDLQQELNLTGADVTNDYIAAANADAHKIAAAVVPVLQAVKAKKDDTPSMTYATSQALINSSIQNFVGSRATTIKSESSISRAANQISTLVMKSIPTLTCANPVSNTTATNSNNAVFAIDATGNGTFGATFTVPAGKTNLDQLRLNVNDQQVAKYFQIKIYQGTSISGTALYTSEQIYFLNPNRNPRDPQFGFRSTGFNVNIPVTAGQQYLIQVLGGGGVDQSGNAAAGIVIADPANGDRILLGGSTWGTAALAADFCYH